MLRGGLQALTAGDRLRLKENLSMSWGKLLAAMVGVSHDVSNSFMENHMKSIEN